MPFTRVAEVTPTLRSSLFVALLALTGVTSAGALICTPKSPEDIARTAEIAFVGSVSAIERSPYKPSELCWEESEGHSKCGGKLVTFRVSQRLRGEVGSSVTVVSEDGCYCLGQYWTVSADYLVVAKPNTSGVPGQLIAANVCDGTGPAGESGPVIKALGRAQKAARR